MNANEVEQTAPETGGKKRGLPAKRFSVKKLILILLLLAALAAAGWGVYRMFFTEEERQSVTAKTTFGALNEALEGSGTTTPADSVTYDVNGTILEWKVQAGDAVKEGDLLYVLDSSDVEDEIMDFEVEMDSLQTQLAEIQENISNQWVNAAFSGRIQDIRVKAGDRVQNGAALAMLVDDSAMKATLYFSYAFRDDFYKGMAVTASLPDQMLTLAGSVTELNDVNYLTATGMECFAAVVSIPNPGSLTEGMEVTVWATGADGAEIYPAESATLEYNRSTTVTADASGELSSVNAVNYARVTAGQTLFVVDASSYETQQESVQKQIRNYEERIADLRESIDTEYTRYSDITGTVVSADYTTNRMTGGQMGSIVIYNQDSMQITVNIDEQNADLLTVGMEVTVYRTTTSDTVYYPATLTYLSLEATSGGNGVSTFAATITIDSQGELSSGVTVYYSIDTTGEGGSEETVLAPINAICSYDDGYYLVVQSDTPPAETIDPAQTGGSVTEYPQGFYAVPVEAGSFNENYIQILSGVEKDQTLFLRYVNAAPSGGSSTSDVDDGEQGNRQDFGGMPGGGMPGGMPNAGGGGMPNFGGGSSGGNRPSGGGMPGMP